MITTTVAGSLPKPAWLAEPEKIWAPWRLEGADLIEGQQDAALAWIKIQEDAGIDVVTDGEQFRKHFVHGFLETIEGIDWELMTTMGIRNDRYEATVPTVTADVARTGSVHGASSAFCRAHTDRGLRVTMPGPMTICDTIANTHYETRAEMAFAFAALLNDEAKELEAIGVDAIQFDEPAFNAFLSDAAGWGVQALNRAVEGLSVTTTVHICYGYGIKPNIDWKRSLGDEWREYDEFFPALNASNIDQVSLECAGSHVPMDVMRHLEDKEVLVGVIDVATDVVETPARVADTLRRASEFVSPERIVASTNCGMAPLSRSLSEAKLRALGSGAAQFRAEIG